MKFVKMQTKKLGTICATNVPVLLTLLTLSFANITKTLKKWKYNSTSNFLGDDINE